MALPDWISNQPTTRYDDGEKYLVIVETTQETRLVEARSAMDGGMVEFRDAITKKFVGCAGINWWKSNAVLFDASDQELPSMKKHGS